MGYSVEIQYVINEEKKIVVATAVVDWSHELDMLGEAAKAELNPKLLSWYVSSNIKTRYKYRPEKFAAHARWDGDESLPWDPEFGKALARARLVNKIDRAYVKMMDMILMDMTKAITSMREVCEKNWAKINEAGERRKREIGEYVAEHTTEDNSNEAES